MKERKNFVEAIENESKQTKTLTENLALAYETSGKNLLDFNFKLVQYRNMSEEDIKKDFSRVFFEDPKIATKFVFYVGDIRGGLGERKIFNACYNWLAYNKSEIAIALLDLIPEYTRWDNLCKLVLNKNTREEALKLIKSQLTQDYIDMQQGKPISLLAKWMPSINTSSKDTVDLAKFICKGLGATPKTYRKTLSRLRKYLDVVEVKMSSNDWGSIDYTCVPSQANLKYNKAFLRNDEERRIEYLESLKKGETKINASVAQPHEIVAKYKHGYCYWDLDVNDYDATLEEMWKALPDIKVEDTLVVRDGSGSMLAKASSNTTCLDVATALAIYCAEHNSEAWVDKFITFSRRPKFVNLSKCRTLRDKLYLCYKESEVSNTDIAKTMRLILDTAINNNMTQEDMPSNILIISDMQFDIRWNSFNWNESLFDSISREYNEHGYKLPRIIFWNVDAAPGRNTIPMQDNDLGLILCSGFSTTNMKMFMSGEVDPYKVLIDQLNTDRYNIIGERIADLI